MQTAVYNKPQKKLFRNKFFTFLMQNNPFRGELVEVEMKVVGKRITYTYTKVRERN